MATNDHRPGRPPRPVEQRFYEKVDTDGPIQPHCAELGPCHAWTGGKFATGYGQFHFRGEHKAHRVAWILAHGPILDGLWVLHRCDNRACVNVRHLFLGDHEANVADMMAKGRGPGGPKHYSKTMPHRLARGERHGSRLHPELVPRGSQHGNAKLSEPIVAAVRRALSIGVSCAELGRRFGVTDVCISHIKHGRAWKHVSGPVTD